MAREMYPIQSRGAREEELVDLDNAQDVSFWMSEFEVSKEELNAAVRAAGPAARDVRAFLSTRLTRS
ncbi:MAG TPA: DUF3606 domain-containing protein [Polyangiaceae bacterium]|nr:DUF3606 domain-containing protein [Polyangiaceae bacterium]